MKEKEEEKGRENKKERESKKERTANDRFYMTNQQNFADHNL